MYLLQEKLVDMKKKKKKFSIVDFYGKLERINYQTSSKFASRRPTKKK